MAEMMKIRHLNGKCPYCNGRLFRTGVDNIYSMQESMECSECGCRLAYSIKDGMKHEEGPRP